MDMVILHNTDDIEVLRSTALSLLVERDTQLAARNAIIARHEHTLAYRQAKIDALLAQVAQLKRWQFGCRADTTGSTQHALFEEGIHRQLAALTPATDDLREPGTRASRQTPKREALPAHLPRIKERHEPTICNCAICGSALISIGEDESEQLDAEPARFFVRKHIYPTYACRSCVTLTVAPVPAVIIDRDHPAPGLLAQVLVNKYADHLPLHRQAQIAMRSGVTLALSKLAGWVSAAGTALAPLVAAMGQDLLREPVLHADETPLAFALDAGQTRRAYLFAYRSANSDVPITIFDFCSGCSGEHTRRYLGEWHGALMVADFSGHKALFNHGITELACWAHARHKFYALHRAGGCTAAHMALQYIAHLYRVEADARGLDPPQRHAYRQQHSLPILQAYRAWIETVRPTAAGNRDLAKALDYTIKRWPALARCFDDSRYPIDNNPIEDVLRPIVLGRKSWLFAGSQQAGERATVIMSLIATARACGHDPYAYLKDVLTRLPTHLDRRIGELLPHRWVPAV